MSYRRAAVLFAAMVFVAAACNPSGGATTRPSAAASSAPSAATSSVPSAPASQAAGECVVGVSYNNYQEERWALRDEPAMKAAIEAGGGTYISNDADSSEERQASNVENLITQGANVLVILAQNTDAILPVVDAAIADGIPVVAYDRLIESPDVLYTSFDNVRVGEMEAEAVLAVVDSGNFVIIKGNGADANSDFLRQGYTNAGIPDEGQSSDTITIVGETYTDDWDPDLAQDSMEQFLTANDNDVDAVLSENDGMAGGVVAALEAQGLAGEIPVSGQDGDLAALNRVALGTQTVSVWKDSRELGTATGEAAIQLCADPDPAAVDGTEAFTTPGDNEVSSILLDPIPVTADNLDVVLDAGWIDEATLCQGVPAGTN
ncbi:MAG: substrate-binding domain-containing protein, partial [Candidatus Limnocylindrales bacterium]